MPEIHSHRDLDVWQRSIELVALVYRLTARFPEHERFGLTAQMRRAAVSVPSNIAEGAGRVGTRDYIRFIGMARGSLAEIDTQLALCVRLGIAPSDDIRQLQEEGTRVGQMLTRLNHALRNRANR